MRMSELSRSSGVPVATIKFYLREGLLPPGRALGATQAEYDEPHVERLRLVRALVDVGRLPLASVRAVLAAVDAEDDALAGAVGTAHEALPPAVPEDAAAPDLARAAVARLGWDVGPDSAALRQLDVALRAVDGLGMPMDEDRLDAYGRAALQVAEMDLTGMPGSPADAVRWAVIGTVMYEPILLALRKLAQQHLYEGGGEPPPGAVSPR